MASITLAPFATARSNAAFGPHHHEVSGGTVDKFQRTIRQGAWCASRRSRHARRAGRHVLHAGTCRDGPLFAQTGRNQAERGRWRPGWHSARGRSCPGAGGAYDLLSYGKDGEEGGEKLDADLTERTR